MTEHSLKGSRCLEPTALVVRGSEGLSEARRRGAAAVATYNQTAKSPTSKGSVQMTRRPNSSGLRNRPERRVRTDVLHACCVKCRASCGRGAETQERRKPDKKDAREVSWKVKARALYASRRLTKNEVREREYLTRARLLTDVLPC